jgi:hypothetical protein
MTDPNCKSVELGQQPQQELKGMWCELAHNLLQNEMALIKI